MKKSILLILAGLLVIGCSQGSSTDAAEASSEATAGTDSTTTEYERVIRLLEPGAEPRIALRYDIPTGQVERVTMDMAFAAAADLGGEVETEAASPPIRLVLELGPTSVGAEPHWVRYGLAVKEVTILVEEGADPEDIAAVEAEVAPLAGIQGTVDVCPRGIPRSANFEIPAEVSQRMLTLLGNIRTSIMSVPLPIEPVGVGARWEVTRDVDLGTITVHQSVTYTLSNISGPVEAPAARIQVSFRQSADPQPMRELAEGIEGRVEAYETSGVGSIDMDISRLVPYSEGDITTQTRAVLTVDGEEELLEARSRAVVQVAPIE